jgi:hypothetical protein
MIGRGTRTHHEKPYLTIVDFVDNTYRHKLKTAASLLGVDAKINFRGGDILDAKETVDKIQDLNSGYDLDKLDFDRLNYIMEEVDLKAGLKTPHEIANITNFWWMRYGEESYRVNIGDGRYFIVRPTLTGQYEAIFEYWDKDEKRTITEYLGEESGLTARDKIIERVDAYITANYQESLRLIKKDARWMKDKISDAQVDALIRLGVSQDVIASLDNKGEAAMLQNKLYSQKALKHDWNKTRMKASWR